MAITYKDISQLSQKSSVAGTEKLPVSDTEYITPNQISSGSLPLSGGTMTGAITPDTTTQYATDWQANSIRTKYVRFANHPNATSVGSTGWYRVWYGNATDIQGTSLIMNLTKTYNSGGSEAYTIEVSIAGQGAINITQLSGCVQTTQHITKVRVVYTYNTADALFVDFYYNGSVSNQVDVYGIAGKGHFQAPESTSASVSNSKELTLQKDMVNTSNGITAGGTVTGTGFIVTGSSGLLKADGTVDSNTYALASSVPATLDDLSDGSTRKLSNYLPLAGGTMTGDIKMTDGEYINASNGYAMLGQNGSGTFYSGPGYGISSFLLRSGNVPLTHRKHTSSSAYTDYKIYDASNITISSSEPTSSQGENGDIWIKI